MRFQVIKTALDGTNDVPVSLGVPMESITVYGDTTTVTLSVRPSAGSDFQVLNNGAGFNYERVGRLIDPCVMTLRASSALTVYIVIGLPE